MEFIEAVLLTVITASTPLLLAASGELVVERAGVLNLGLEGMMIVGGACGFAGAYLTGSIAFGAGRFSHVNGLWVVDADGGAPRRIVRAEVSALEW